MISDAVVNVCEGESVMVAPEQAVRLTIKMACNSEVSSFFIFISLVGDNGIAADKGQD